MLRLGDILEALIERPLPAIGPEIRSAQVDSRLVADGSLFVALPGEHHDGHEFVAEAFERGAVAALVQRPMQGLRVVDVRHPLSEADIAGIEPPVCLLVDDTLRSLQQAAAHWRAKLALKVIGVTGSVGKSTTKEIAADVLGQRYRTQRSQGNLNNEVGLPLTLLHLREATDRAVLEMGFYVPGEIALLCRLARPAVGVVTNISQVHLERAKTMEAIVQGKGELVESLPPAPEGIAILNYDEPLVLGMAARTQASVFTYGLSPEADLWADEVEGLGLEGVRFVMHYQGEEIHVRVPMLGRHSVHTALRATAVGLCDGLTWEEIVNGLQSGHSQLRLVAVEGPGGALILDDTYNAAPVSVIAALNLLGELEGHKVAVLGDMLELGEFEERGHYMVGARAASIVDDLVAVGPRAAWIAKAAEHAGLDASHIVRLEDSASATAYLQGKVGEGDVVLIKASRGMHLDEVVAALEVDE
jgi:UDP-N-acetylmuramoyl-tripeptide--D-alanyl-D-alanine ligase